MGGQSLVYQARGRSQLLTGSLTVCLSPLIQCNFLIEPLTIAQIQFSLFQVLRRHPYLLTQINIAFRGGQVDAFFIKYK